MCRLLGIYGQVDFWQEIVLGFRRQAEFGNIPPVGFGLGIRPQEWVGDGRVQQG